jgi:serine/threonine protein kinase
MTKKYGFDEAKEINISIDKNKLLYKKIKTKKYDEYWELLKECKGIDNLSPKFKNIFLKMVAYNPDERPSIEEIKKDEFMADIVNASEEYINFLRQKMINEIEFANPIF